MPHIIVKLLPGRSEEQKKTLTAKLVRDITGTLGAGEDSVSVAMEEIASADWTKKVYRPDIEPNMDTLYKRPGYKPF